jgi:hypothetical protein
MNGFHEKVLDEAAFAPTGGISESFRAFDAFRK